MSGFNFSLMTLKLLGIILFPGIYLFPFAFYQSGVILSTITIIVIVFFIIALSTMQVEAIAIYNSLKNEEKDFINTVKNSLDEDSFSNENSQNDILDAYEDTAEVEVIQISSYSNSNVKEDQDNFFIRKKFDVCEIADKTFPSKSKQRNLIKLIVILYYIISISISLSFCSSTIFNYFNVKTIEKGESLDYYVYVILVLLISFIASVVSQIKTNIIIKILTGVFVVFILMFLISISYLFSDILLSEHYSNSLINDFEVSNFNSLVGVCFYSFALFPYIPSFIENFSPQKKFFNIICLSMFISIIVILVYSVLALTMFSNVLTCDNYSFPTAIKLNFIDNFITIPGISDLLNLSQVLLIFQIGFFINKMKYTRISFIPKFIYLYGNKRHRITNTPCIEWFRVFLFTLVLIIPSLLLSTLVALQHLINYVMPAVGYLIIGFVFTVLISHARKRISNYEIPKGKMHVSFIKSKIHFILLYILILLGVTFSIISYFSIDNKVCIRENRYEDYFIE